MRDRLNQGGFVSLVTCILISLLLIIITVGLLSVEALQLRKAEDAEQSLNAYYTAESGIEDGVAKVLSGLVVPSAGTGCLNGSVGSNGATWTCQQISESGQPTGSLTADQAVTIDPGPSSPAYGSVVLEWQTSNDLTAADYNVDLSQNNGLPTASEYQSDNYAAAPLELQIVEYPTHGFTENDVCAKPSGGPCTLGNPSRAFIQNLLMTPEGGVHLAPNNICYAGCANIIANSNMRFTGNCGPLPHPNPYESGNISTKYNCYALLSNLPAGKAYLFRVRARYISSDYKFTFYTGSHGDGLPVSVDDGTATIDVTAQAGQVYRRVISKLPINPAAAGGLNYVMFSDNNVCKDFVVTNNAIPGSGCPY